MTKPETVILTVTEKIIIRNFYMALFSGLHTHCILQSPTFSRLNEKKIKGSIFKKVIHISQVPISIYTSLVFLTNVHVLYEKQQYTRK